MDGCALRSMGEPSLRFIHRPLLPPPSREAALWAELSNEYYQTTVANTQPERTLQYWVVSDANAIAI